MSERDNENFDLDEEFLAEAEDNTDYDRILDKVNREGMTALSAEERRFLKRASDRLRR